jgi:hypothetical protein
MSEEKSITDLPRHRPQVAATRDGRVVPETDPEAAYVLSESATEEDAQRFGVTLEAVRKARAQAEAAPAEPAEPEKPAKAGKAVKEAPEDKSA